jgi:hypothetical protein
LQGKYKEKWRRWEHAEIDLEHLKDKDTLRKLSDSVSRGKGMSEDSVELFICPSCKKPSRRSVPVKSNLVTCENCGKLVPADLPKADLVETMRQRYSQLEKEYRESDSRLGQALAHGIKEYMSDYYDFEEWLLKEHGIERVKTLTPGEHGQEFLRFMLHKDGIDRPTKISRTPPPKPTVARPQTEVEGPELYCLFCNWKQKYPQSDIDKTNLKELDDAMYERMKG